MHYYGTRLSGNIPRRGPDLISVFRPEEEIFAPEPLASFEGTPATNDHPPDGMDTGNIRAVKGEGSSGALKNWCTQNFRERQEPVPIVPQRDDTKKVPDRVIDRTGTDLTCMHHRMLISY